MMHQQGSTTASGPHDTDSTPKTPHDGRLAPNTTRAPVPQVQTPSDINIPTMQGFNQKQEIMNERDIHHAEQQLAAMGAAGPTHTLSVSQNQAGEEAASTTNNSASIRTQAAPNNAAVQDRTSQLVQSTLKSFGELADLTEHQGLIGAEPNEKLESALEDAKSSDLLHPSTTRKLLRLFANPEGHDDIQKGLSGLANLIKATTDGEETSKIAESMPRPEKENDGRADLHKTFPLITTLLISRKEKRKMLAEWGRAREEAVAGTSQDKTKRSTQNRKTPGLGQPGFQRTASRSRNASPASGMKVFHDPEAHHVNAPRESYEERKRKFESSMACRRSDGYDPRDSDTVIAVHSGYVPALEDDPIAGRSAVQKGPSGVPNTTKTTTDAEKTPQVDGSRPRKRKSRSGGIDLHKSTDGISKQNGQGEDRHKTYAELERELEFAVAYGHLEGYGPADIGNTLATRGHSTPPRPAPVHRRRRRTDRGEDVDGNPKAEEDGSMLSNCVVM